MPLHEGDFTFLQGLASYRLFCRAAVAVDWGTPLPPSVDATSADADLDPKHTRGILEVPSMQPQSRLITSLLAGSAIELLLTA